MVRRAERCLSAGGQTYKQTFRVERVGTGDDVTIAQEEEGEQGDLNGGILPRVVNPFVRRIIRVTSLESDA